MDRWCCPEVVIALGAGGACLWSVPGAVSGQGSVGCCQLITKLGGELTVEAVLRNLSGATFLRRVLEVVPCDWASL